MSYFRVMNRPYRWKCVAIVSFFFFSSTSVIKNRIELKCRPYSHALLWSSMLSNTVSILIIYIPWMVLISICWVRQCSFLLYLQQWGSAIRAIIKRYQSTKNLWCATYGIWLIILDFFEEEGRESHFILSFFTVWFGRLASRLFVISHGVL